VGCTFPGELWFSVYSDIAPSNRSHSVLSRVRSRMGCATNRQLDSHYVALLPSLHSHS